MSPTRKSATARLQSIIMEGERNEGVVKMAVNTKALPRMAVRINGTLRKQLMMTIAPLLARSSVFELLSLSNGPEWFISPLSNP